MEPPALQNVTLGYPKCCFQHAASHLSASKITLSSTLPNLPILQVLPVFSIQPATCQPATFCQSTVACRQRGRRQGRSLRIYAAPGRRPAAGVSDLPFQTNPVRDVLKGIPPPAGAGLPPAPSTPLYFWKHPETGPSKTVAKTSKMAPRPTPMGTKNHLKCD